MARTIDMPAFAAVDLARVRIDGFKQYRLLLNDVPQHTFTCFR
jgi:hypothetical protein